MADERVFLSVVVPCYNVERTLSRLLNSINEMDNLENNDLEVILVDDGSTGPFPAVDASSYSFRIQYFRIQNSGPLKARMYGIEQARGQYVYFADADDVLLPGFISDLKMRASESEFDICLVNYAVEKKRGSDYVKRFVSQPDDKYYIRELIGTGGLGFSCSQVFRKSFFNQFDFSFFDNNMRLGEDSAFWMALFQPNRIYVSLKKEGYRYLLNEGSASNSINFEKFKDIVSVLTKRVVFFEKYGRLAGYTIDEFLPDFACQILYLRHVILSKMEWGKRKECRKMLCKIPYSEKVCSSHLSQAGFRQRILYLIFSLDRFFLVK